MGGWTSGAPARRLTAALSVAVFLAYFDRSMPAAGAALLKQELALSDAALGFAIATSAALSYAAVALAVATAGGRWRRAAILGGMTCWTIGAAALAWVRSFAGLIAAEIAIGAGQALFAPAAAALIADAAAPGALARSMARYTLASTTGRTSAVLIAGALIAAVAVAGLTPPGLPAPWRAIFLLSAIPNVAAILLVGGLMARAETREAVAVERPPPDRAATHWRGRVGGFAMATAPIIVIQTIGLWYPTLLARIAGWSAADAAMAAGGATLAMAVAGQWLGARWLDRHPAARDRPIAVIGGAIAIAGLTIAALARLGPGWALAALAIADGALGAATVASLATVQTLLPPGARRRGNSLFFAVVTLIGVGLGPLLAGAISDAGGASGATLATGLAIVAAAALALAIGGRLLAGRGSGYRQGRAGRAIEGAREGGT